MLGLGLSIMKRVLHDTQQSVKMKTALFVRVNQVHDPTDFVCPFFSFTEKKERYEDFLLYSH